MRRPLTALLLLGLAALGRAEAPSSVPGAVLTPAPTVAVTAASSALPTPVPTAGVSEVATAVPTAAATTVAMASPTVVPVAAATMVATALSTAMPTAAATAVATALPTTVPTVVATTPSTVPTAVMPGAETTHPKRRDAGADAVAADLSPTAWSDHGLEYRVSFSGLSLFNASPLAYSPIEVGWRFANGVRVRSGLDLFFYEGQEPDPNNPGSNAQFSYGMQDWRTTLAYEVPLPSPVRPVVGVCLEFLWGTRQELTNPATPTVPYPSQSSWSGMGPGGVMGLEWRISSHCALSTLARYTLPFGEPNGSALVALDFGVHYLF